MWVIIKRRERDRQTDDKEGDEGGDKVRDNSLRNYNITIDGEIKLQWRGGRRWWRRSPGEERQLATRVCVFVCESELITGLTRYGEDNIN